MDKRDSTVVRAKRQRTFLEHLIISTPPQNDDDVQRSRALVIQYLTTYSSNHHPYADPRINSRIALDQRVATRTKDLLICSNGGQAKRKLHAGVARRNEATPQKLYPRTTIDACG